eukprot:COSAG01_NODE_14418_length_1456_cov_1.146647_1_plen_52_part_10
MLLLHGARWVDALISTQSGASRAPPSSRAARRLCASNAAMAPHLMPAVSGVA